MLFPLTNLQGVHFSLRIFGLRLEIYSSFNGMKKRCAWDFCAVEELNINFIADSCS